MRFLWFLFLLLMIAPLGALFVGDAPTDSVQLVPSLMQEAIYNTFFLATGVTALSASLGVLAAWCVNFYPLWGRSFLQRGFCLPLVFPAYVLAFIFLGGISDFILLQGQLWALTVVMSLSLFPYIYIFASSAFLSITTKDWEVHELSGQSFVYFLKKVVLPKISPLLLSSMILVLFETLADFGAASVLNVPVITTLIYKLWYDLFSFAAATQLAIQYLIIIFFVLVLEKVFKREGGLNYHLNSRPRKEISKWANIGLSFVCWSFLMVAVVFPLLQIALWLMEGFQFSQLSEALWALFRTVALASLCGGIVLCLSFSMGYLLRKYRQKLSSWESVATLGYSVPGSILAVAIFSMGLFIFPKISEEISFVLLVFGLCYKFFPVSLRSVGGGLAQIPLRFDEFSQTTGASFYKTLRKIHIPLLWKPIFVSLALVVIEVMKEMPLTLMLSPSSFTTLSIQIFNLTSEGEWEKAALPSLFLIVAGFASTMLLFLSKGKEKHGNS